MPFCPKCASPVESSAIQCPQCKADLQSGQKKVGVRTLVEPVENDLDSSKTQTPAQDGTQFYCPSCSSPIESPATECPKCGAKLQTSPTVGKRTLVEPVDNRLQAADAQNADFGSAETEVTQLFCPTCSAPIDASATQCPQCHSNLTANQRVGRGTLLEPMQPAIIGGISPTTEAAPEFPAELPDEELTLLPDEGPQIQDVVDGEPGSGTRLFCPLNRPPMPVLCAFDDGCRASGEKWRIRQSRFVIGRATGDAVFAHDMEISGQHAEVSWQQNEPDGAGWYLIDLNSRNGTFVRASQAPLSDGDEIIIGRSRFQFKAGSPPGSEPTGSAAQIGMQTIDARSGLVAGAPGSSPQASPMLVEQTAQCDARTYALTEPEYWIGTDSQQCSLVIEGDPFIDPKHARIWKQKNGRWLIRNEKSSNGLWVRIQKCRLSDNLEFQLGEQRFQIRIPNPPDA